MRYRVSDFSQDWHVSLPMFNDLHHVTPTARGSVLVAVTGLDMAVELAMDGSVVREWDVMGDPLWTRFSREIDYRKIRSTKPHIAHPNYIFGVGVQWWVTRCDTEDAICLLGGEARMPIGIGLLHDGQVKGRSAYFTMVKGRVAEVDCDTHELRNDIDLVPLVNDAQARPLGWCRGLKFLAKDQLVIGFSRFRHTKGKENLIWLRDQLASLSPRNSTPWYPLPTRISCFDLGSKEHLWDIDLEKYGMSAVFSIHNVAEPDRIPI